MRTACYVTCSLFTASLCHCRQRSQQQDGQSEYQHGAPRALKPGLWPAPSNEAWLTRDAEKIKAAETDDSTLASGAAGLSAELAFTTKPCAVMLGIDKAAEEKGERRRMDPFLSSPPPAQACGTMALKEKTTGGQCAWHQALARAACAHGGCSLQMQGRAKPSGQKLTAKCARVVTCCVGSPSSAGAPHFMKQLKNGRHASPPRGPCAFCATIQQVLTLWHAL